jgi:hypothetical protein
MWLLKLASAIFILGLVFQATASNAMGGCGPGLHWNGYHCVPNYGAPYVGVPYVGGVRPYIGAPVARGYARGYARGVYRGRNPLPR